MAINFKPINEVPVVEELAEGDMLLVNSSGAAKQIDASKIGGGGGGTVIYIAGFTPNEESTEATGVPCKDAEMTQVMSTAELAAAISSGPVVLYTDAMGVPAWITAVTSVNMGGTWMSYLVFGEATMQLIYICSDMAG